MLNGVGPAIFHLFAGFLGYALLAVFCLCVGFAGGRFWSQF